MDWGEAIVAERPFPALARPTPSKKICFPTEVLKVQEDFSPLHLIVLNICYRPATKLGFFAQVADTLSVEP